jgi:hypothetical protein
MDVTNQLNDMQISRMDIVGEERLISDKPYSGAYSSPEYAHSRVSRVEHWARLQERLGCSRQFHNPEGVLGGHAEDLCDDTR